MQWALQVIQRFSVPVQLEADLESAIQQLASDASAVLQRRVAALAFWEAEAHRLLPETARRIAALPDPDLRALLLGGSVPEAPQLGQVCHVALYEAMLQHCSSVDQLLVQDLLEGFPIVGPIHRSGRWPPYDKAQPALAIGQALERAWEIRAKIIKRVQSPGIRESAEDLGLYDRGLQRRLV